MKKRLIIAIVRILFIGLFFVFTFVVRSDVLRPMDFDMTVKLQGRIPPKSYEYLGLITEVARFEVITVLIFLLLIVGRQWRQMIVVFGAYAGAHVLELVGKLILSQPPPPFMFYKLPTTFWFPSHYVAEGKNSYPSGHSLRAFFFALLVSSIVLGMKKIPMMIRLVVIIGMFGMAGLIALAKVALGQHWTTDVIAGSMLGIGTALVCVSFFRGRKNKTSPR